MHVAVVGAGITGLAAAHRLLTSSTAADWTGPSVRVTVFDGDDRVGGKIRTSRFAGIDIDEGADAYLARIPHAVLLAREVGLGEMITNPRSGHAAVMHNGLQRIPDGLMLGVPTGVMSLARSPLMSWRGKLRAALEPLLPSSGSHHDSIGTFVRQRFGKEVHQLLVDPLVGGIYASDTDEFSLEMVPQLHDLSHGRSVLLTARRRMAATPKPSGAAAPVFETPIGGLGALVEATAAAIERMGGSIVTSSRVASISRRSHHYELAVGGPSGEHVVEADAVIVAAPGAQSRDMLGPLDPDVAAMFGSIERASVVMVTLKTAEAPPASLEGMSGYLVPKPDQQRVTAASFGSNKWAHWKPADGTMIMRVSLGRDGVPTHDLIHEWSDDQLVTRVVDEVSAHTGFSFTPEVTRVTRWEGAFPQYRPGHGPRIADIEHRLATTAPGVLLAGASVRGIGIPACVGQGRTAAETTLARLVDLRN